MAEMKKQRKLVLENGNEYVGTGFGSTNEALYEMVFNTSMVGYQELVTDPGYTARILMMTYPLIGSYGINDEDYESRTPTLGGLVVREYCDSPSNFRYTKTLAELLEENGIPGLEGVDTREICRVLRSEGSQRALICDADVDKEEALARIRAYEAPTDLIQRVSCKKKWYARTPNPRYSVVAIDTGIRLSLIRELNQLGCNVTVVPYDTSAETILGFKPNGLLLPNGTGSPAYAGAVVETVRQLRGKLPIFGVGMGHQILCMACGAKTIRLKAGHNGGNQPVRVLETGALEITSQNHQHVVEETSLEGTGLKVTHRNLLDNTIEGVAHETAKLFSVQYQPHDGGKLFGKFIAMMEEEKKHAKAY